MSIYFRFSTEPKSLSCFLIRQATWSEYSHVDIVVPEGLLGAQADGVAIREYNYEPSAKVLYVRADCFSPEQEATMRKFWYAQIGKPYDFGAILGVLAHHDWRNLHAWYCSEFGFAPSVLVGRPFLNETHIDRVTPGMLLLSPYLVPCEPPPRDIKAEQLYHARHLTSLSSLHSLSAR